MTPSRRELLRAFFVAPLLAAAAKPALTFTSYSSFDYRIIPAPSFQDTFETGLMMIFQSPWRVYYEQEVYQWLILGGKRPQSWESSLDLIEARAGCERGVEAPEAAELSHRTATAPTPVGRTDRWRRRMRRPTARL